MYRSRNFFQTFKENRKLHRADFKIYLKGTQPCLNST